MTALTVYLNTNHSTTPGLTSTACILSEVLGSGSALTNNSLLGTATGYGELYSRANAGAWAAAGSLGSPSGNGWIDDLATLEGCQFASSNWTPSLRVFSTIGTLTGVAWMRSYAYNIGQKTYTAIGSWSSASSSITTGGVNLSLTASNPGVFNFGVGDRLYVDAWVNVTVNGLGNSTTVIKVSGSSVANTGIATSQLVTSGYSLRTGVVYFINMRPQHRTGRSIGRITTP